MASKKLPVKQEQEDLVELPPTAEKTQSDGVEPARKDGAGASAGVEDWEIEVSPEEAALQAVFERLQDKGEKEVMRALKVSLVRILTLEIDEPQAIEFDRRMALSFPKLEINRNIRDEILAFALEEDGAAEMPRTINSADDKVLLRYFVAWHVLEHLGFRPNRILQCLTGGIGEEEGWEEAVNWVSRSLSSRTRLILTDVASPPGG